MFTNGREAYDMEQHILKRFKIYKYNGDSSLLSGKTELFSKNIIDKINKILKEI